MSTRPPATVRLEGFHAVKHALRFGARVSDLVTPDPAAILALVDSLAPDTRTAIESLLRTVTPAEWRVHAHQPLPSPVIGYAARPTQRLGARGLVVALDGPAHAGNVGACVRVAAAAGAAGLVSAGPVDPWGPAAVRGGAGLQFALPVAGVDDLPVWLRDQARPVLALDPTGRPLAPGRVPPDAVLVFGSERRGLSPDVRASVSAVLSLPMRPGVSSLNLATSVAAALYSAWLPDSIRSSP